MGILDLLKKDAPLSDEKIAISVKNKSTQNYLI